MALKDWKKCKKEPLTWKKGNQKIQVQEYNVYGSKWYEVFNLNKLLPIGGQYPREDIAIDIAKEYMRTH